MPENVQLFLETLFDKLLTNEKDFWMMVRTALLTFVEAIERKFDILPRTSQLRRETRQNVAIVKEV